MVSDNTTGLLVLGALLLCIGGIVVSAVYVGIEDKQCREISDRMYVSKGWELNKTLLNQFDKCCDRGYAYDNKTSTVWCFG